MSSHENETIQDFYKKMSSVGVEITLKTHLNLMYFKESFLHVNIFIKQLDFQE